MRKNKKAYLIKMLSLLVTMMLLVSTLYGCENKKKNQSEGTNNGEITPGDSIEGINMPEVEWKDEPTVGEEVTEDITAVITLSGTSAAAEGNGVTIEDKVVTITEAGTYVVQGTLEDGQLVVDTQSEENVKIILNGAKITNSNSSAIYVISSPGKTILHCQKGSVNCIVDGETYTGKNEDSEPNAAVFAKDDLKISGSGELYITGNYGKGVSCKDDLEIKNASVFVNAADDALRGKDSVTIEGAYLYLLAGGDGIRTSNETEEEEGNMVIVDSECYITAALDGIQAILDLNITNCTMGISTSGGSTGGNNSTASLESSQIVTTTASQNQGGNAPGGQGGGQGGMPGGQGGMGGMQEGNSNEYADSCKGLKAGGSLTVTGGSYTVDSYDDAFHCGETLTVKGGDYCIATGDDAFHADNILIIEDGNISITTSYEGLEAQEIYYNGGTTRITASDDGVNGAGGNDESGTAGQWGDMFRGSSGNAIVELNGGYLVVNASGDGLDCNGSMTMNGGTVIVYGPTNDGNGALDYDGSFQHTGGTLLAVGSSGMAQSVTSDYGVLAFTCGMNAETIMSIQDEDGNILISFAAPKIYSCVVFASEDVKEGVEYSIYTEGSYDIEAVDGIYKEGNYSGGSLLGTLEAN